MIPPIWNRSCCDKCKSTDIDEFGFCNNCEEPVVSSLEAEFKASFAISKWTANSPSNQQHRCMICGRQGEFPVSLRKENIREKMALFFITHQRKYQSLAAYWGDDPPETLAQALVDKREKSLYEVKNLPEELTELHKYADPPVICLHCMSSFSSEEPEEKKKVIKPPNLKAAVQSCNEPASSSSSESVDEFEETWSKAF